MDRLDTVGRLSDSEERPDGPAPSQSSSTVVDVVLVAYNSRSVLRRAVLPLLRDDSVCVIVVDNASPDDSLAVVRDLPIETVELAANGGFAHGCNRGWQAGSAPYVLFLNPDAEITSASIRALIDALAEHPQAGAVAPKVVGADGELDYSLRRFPRLRTTYAQALFLHRVFPEKAWTDELVRDPHSYAERHAADWVSGVCILVRRAVLEEIGGWDEGFFMYGEDIDLCRRIRAAGYEIEYVPGAEVMHAGGGSAPRSSLLPVLAASRMRYASKHASGAYALLERLGIAIGSLTHLILGSGGTRARQGHARALLVALGMSRPRRP